VTGLLFIAAAGTVKLPQVDLFDTEGVKWVSLEHFPTPLKEYEMPEKCQPCSSASLWFRAICSDVEKTLAHYLIRRDWLVKGVAERPFVTLAG
jgi:hypothetical protein